MKIGNPRGPKGLPRFILLVRLGETNFLWIYSVLWGSITIFRKAKYEVIWKSQLKLRHQVETMEKSSEFGAVVWERVDYR